MDEGASEMKEILLPVGLVILVLGGIIGFYFINPANRDKITNYISNAPATVECYSGGKLIYSGKSVGKPVSESNSDGYTFRENGTDELVEVSGNCVIRYGN